MSYSINNINKYLYNLPDVKLNNKILFQYYKEGRKDKVLEAFQLYIGKKGRVLEKDLNYILPFEDIYQQVNIALWKAINIFDIDKSDAIVSYMTFTIDNAIKRIFSNHINNKLYYTAIEEDIDTEDIIEEEFRYKNINIDDIKYLLDKNDIIYINLYLQYGCWIKVSEELNIDVKYIYNRIRTIKKNIKKKWDTM